MGKKKNSKGSGRKQRITKEARTEGRKKGGKAQVNWTEEENSKGRKKERNDREGRKKH